MTYRKLSDQERSQLIHNGCRATAWEDVQVAEGFDPSRIHHVEFVEQVRIGRLTGSTRCFGVEKPSGIFHATLVNCSVGDTVRIAGIRGHLAHYDIQDHVCIEDVGCMVTNPGAQFGNGVEVQVLNEGGGREVTLFNELSAQFAYLQCVHRYQPQLVAALADMARGYAERQRSDRGTVGRGSCLCSAGEIEDVNFGAQATVQGALRLRNGTLLSTADAPSFVGTGVQAEDFIFAEGCKVSSAALLKACFVGQGCQLGRQFSAENSLFFANCEAFHGEAVSVFAGPYSVTHHKSTLLIAGLLSFYNAGSGTNQSNHMYKLGPVHEGKLERGCKTGSFSYMMWPCRVGPFSVVLGKHKRHFDTSDFPFSVIEADAQGRCTFVPGLNMTTVGTVRDGAKWPARDRRSGADKRDRISFDVLSPLTVGRMIRGSQILQKLQQDTDSNVDVVTIHGAIVKRILLRTCLRYYRTGIELYLLEQVVRRGEQAMSDGRSFMDAFVVASSAVYSEDWLDIGGQLMARGRLQEFTEAVGRGTITDVDGFFAALDQIVASYDDDQWAWVRPMYEQVFQRELADPTHNDLLAAAIQLADVKGKFLKQVLLDAQKEFEDRTGYGHGGSADDIDLDFSRVRGSFADNAFVQQVRQELESLPQRVRAFQQGLEKRQALLP